MRPAPSSGASFSASLPVSNLVSSIDLKTGLDRDPVARQMRRSLLDYVAGERFQPEVELTPEQVRELIAEPSAMERLGALSSVSVCCGKDL